MFMNEWDVENARNRYAGDPVLGPATQTLYNLMRWANRNSDGWAYWPKPGRSAQQLEKLIDRADAAYRRYDPDFTGIITAEEVFKAYSPIKAMATRARTGNSKITDSFDLVLPAKGREEQRLGQPLQLRNRRHGNGQDPARRLGDVVPGQHDGHVRLPR